MKILATCTIALALCGCATTAPTRSGDGYVAPSFHAPVAGSLVVLLPARSGDGGYEKANGFVMEQMRKQLTGAGYRVKGLDTANYDVIWSQEVAQVGGIYDPASGALRTEAYARALNVLAQRVATDSGAALVIKPALVLREAKLSGTTAEWDGQRKTPPLKKTYGATYRVDGSTTGISIELLALGADGRVAFKTLGGVTLPYRGDAWDGSSTLRDDLFADDTEIAEGLRIALRPLMQSAGVR